MYNDDAGQDYVKLAEDLAGKRISERNLLKLSQQLAYLDETLLYKLGRRSEDVATSSPRNSWAIAKVAYSAANSQGQDIFVKSLAAWYLGRAYNYWGKPKQVKTAISRARHGFLKLGETGWIAACDWQLYALAWTSPNIPLAINTLKHALESLQHAGFDDFVPHCRMALAYAQLLVGEFSDARENIFASEAEFVKKGDHLNRARCWLAEASCDRRQGRMEEALNNLDKAAIIFEEEIAPVELAKAYYQVGLCRVMVLNDLPTAIDKFRKASELFSARGMELWEATCINNLGYAYSLVGLLETADQCYQQARKSIIHHHALAPLADNLNDTGKLNILRGYLSLSIEQFTQAERIHESLGMKLLAGVDVANLGEAYGLVGRYQDALHHLEKAIERFKLLKDFLRLESAEKFIARIWAQLGQPDVALEHLDKAVAYHEKSNQKHLFTSINNYRASILFKQNKETEAVHYLKLSLKAAMTDGLRPQAALTRRLLGEALSGLEKNTEALDYLTQAYSDFTEMGMVMEQAMTLTTMGMHYFQISELEKAREAFDTALQISQDTTPEIDWRAHAGLASLAEVKGDLQSEFRSYHNATNALAKIRHNFWQPELAGHYLQVPTIVLDNAIRRAAEIQSSEDALQFIEQNKAMTFRLQLETTKIYRKSKKSQDLVNLQAEIRWLQNKLRISFDSTNIVKSAVQTRQMRAQLIEKVNLYNITIARLERQSSSNKLFTRMPNNFDLAIFRELANQALGKSWIALDYYMAGKMLIIVVITPENCQVSNSAISNRIVMALEMITRTQQPMHLSQSDLQTLGDFLIPASLAEFLTPNTYLLLGPHRKLHGVPWSALRPSFLSKPLLFHSLLCVVPSLHSLSILWGRNSLKQILQRENGLVVGLSSFQGTKPDLPYVKDEIAGLYAMLGSNGHFLVDRNATWGKLKRLKTSKKRYGQEESRFHWLHIATHFFADQHTGRLSGLTLWDGEVWLDQLRDLTPLPRLVTFSACNSIFTFVYHGDEHIDLPTTCFTAGANSVVGSIWPILDESAAQFTVSFYRNYLGGLGPAHALNEAQKWMIEQGEQVSNWASFICTGIP